MAGQEARSTLSGIGLAICPQGENMRIGRRDFLGAGLAATGLALAQDEGGPRKTPPIPSRKAKVTKLFKGPDLHPNALAAAIDGLWIGDQVSEKVHKVDWETGKVLLEIQTESHNTSGLAVGAGYLWINANGGGGGRRPPRPTDRNFTEIIQADMQTGKTVKAWRSVWGGGVYGGMFVQETQLLWGVSLQAR